MRYTSAVILLAAASATAQTLSRCLADNCLRALRASAFQTRRGTVDCSSFFFATLTPATLTITETITSSVTTSITVQTTDTTVLSLPPNVAKRQVTVTASSIPAYASPCSGVARYISACSCLGVTRKTTTVLAPSTTITSTSTKSFTSTSVSHTTATSNKFILQAQDGFPGAYIGPQVQDDGTNVVASFTSDPASAVRFTLKPNGNLESTYGIAKTINYEGSPSYIYLNVGNDPLVCMIQGADNHLTCLSNEYSKFGSINDNTNFVMGRSDYPWTDWSPTGVGITLVKAIAVL